MKHAVAAATLKAALAREGKTLAAYAREKDVDYGTAVQLINGFTKGRYGKAHVAAVKLGLKVAA